MHYLQDMTRPGCNHNLHVPSPMSTARCHKTDISANISNESVTVSLETTNDNFVVKMDNYCTVIVKHNHFQLHFIGLIVVINFLLKTLFVHFRYLAKFGEITDYFDELGP